MGIFPYFIVVFIWFLSMTEVLFLQFFDGIIIALVLLGIHKPYSLVLSVVFGLGILSDVILGTVFGIHSVIYMLASMLWLSKFYKRYAKYEVGYYLIIASFMILSQIIFGIERYLSLWEFGVVFEYVIKGIYTASLAIFIDTFIPRPIIELPQKNKAV